MLEHLPQLNIDLTTFLCLAVGEKGMVVLLQASLHAIESIKFDEACSHKLLCALVCSKANVGGLNLCEMLGNGLFSRRVRKIAYGR